MVIMCIDVIYIMIYHEWINWCSAVSIMIRKLATGSNAVVIVIATTVFENRLNL